MRPRLAPVAALQPDASGLAAWAKSEAKTEPKRRSTGISAASMTKAHKEADRRSTEDEWEGAKPLVFVALYALLHEHVYGVPADELKPQDRKLAAFASGRMLKREFEEDATAMANFVRWAWKREAGREKWRRDNGRSGFRLTWRLLFAGGYLMTDYRLDLLRSKGRR